MNNIDNNDDWVSKTKIKKQMDDLQKLGMQLTKLSSDTLKKINLPDNLLEALINYKKINSNSALKRQTQYIGRIMRDIDPKPIEEYLAILKGNNEAHNALMKRIEVIRDQLISTDEAFTDIISQFPNADTVKLRSLIRNTRKEKELNKQPKSYRLLFQELKVILSDDSKPIQENDFDADEA